MTTKNKMDDDIEDNDVHQLITKTKKENES